LARLGPLVRKEVRAAGILLAVASAQFVVAMAVVQSKYPGYTDFGNRISDLGGPHASLGWLFNLSIRVLGVLGVLAALLLRSAFRSGLSSTIGRLLLVLTNVFAFAVGTYPEQYSVHAALAAGAFLGAGFTLFFLSFAMLRDTRWDGGYRLLTFVLAIVTFVALALYESPTTLGLGPGGVERLIVAPILLWAILAGVHLARLPVYSGPGGRAWTASTTP
jgi:hypothetical membrane protein